MAEAMCSPIHWLHAHAALTLSSTNGDAMTRLRSDLTAVDLDDVTENKAHK